MKQSNKLQQVIPGWVLRRQHTGGVLEDLEMGNELQTFQSICTLQMETRLAIFWEEARVKGPHPWPPAPARRNLPSSSHPHGPALGAAGEQPATPTNQTRGEAPHPTTPQPPRAPTLTFFNLKMCLLPLPFVETFFSAAGADLYLVFLRRAERRWISCLLCGERHHSWRDPTPG